MTTYVVNVSGGLTSAEAWERTLADHGKAATVPIFANTKIEDADLYRFLDDLERYFEQPILYLEDGRTPAQVWLDEGAISMGAWAPCSEKLKRDPIEKYIAATFEPGSYVRVFGMSWDEIDRMARLTAQLHPDRVEFPLMQAPFMDKCHIAGKWEARGIPAPRLYTLGFEHNNCGGGCVKAGQAHWARLWFTLPDIYLRWEAEEANFNTVKGKYVSILTDRSGDGVKKTLTLAAFRGRLERGEAYDKFEFGACGCFAQEPQLRMDTLLLQAP